jgi:hypothetical protein
VPIDVSAMRSEAVSSCRSMSLRYDQRQYRRADRRLCYVICLCPINCLLLGDLCVLGAYNLLGLSFSACFERLIKNLMFWRTFVFARWFGAANWNLWAFWSFFFLMHLPPGIMRKSRRLSIRHCSSMLLSWFTKTIYIHIYTYTHACFLCARLMEAHELVQYRILTLWWVLRGSFLVCVLYAGAELAIPPATCIGIEMVWWTIECTTSFARFNKLW